jgi:hypothetical protein
MADLHLNQVALARRWNMSPRTLERWRCTNQGPLYLKLGRHIVYREEDVRAFEAARARSSSKPSDKPAGRLVNMGK